MKNLRLEKREIIKSEIKTLLEDKKRVLFIHYSCESFYDIKDGHTPRITSIAVQYLNTTTTELFSIHKIAEKKQINIDLKTNYDELEKEMLTDFFSFVKKHKEYKWVHWNMRDINYGFGAINNRYEILKGKYYEIKEENKFDLADKLKEFYGKNYIEHPRLEKICDYNKIDRKDFLSGQEEAKAFEEKRYSDLHRSTLRKVKNLKEIFDKAEVKKVGAVNLDLVLRTVCLLVTTNLFLEKAAHNGKIILAANSILFQVQYLMSYIFDGFANASSVFSGIAVGEKDFKKLKWVMRKSIHFCIIISVFLSTAFILGGEKLLLFYTKNTEVINIANQYKMWIIVFPIVVSFGLVIYGNFTGATETAYIRNSMLQSLVFFLILYFTVIPIYQNHGLWLSFIVFSLARSLFLMRYVKKFLEKYKLKLNRRTSINSAV